jgi:hypothetical protein
MAAQRGGRKKGSGKVYRGSPAITGEVWAKFLEVLSCNGGNVTQASEAVGISRDSAHKHKRDDAAFSAAWDDAIHLGKFAILDEAKRRAMTSSDRLLELLVKGLFPEFRDRATPETINLNVNRVHDLSDEELAAIAANGRGGAAAPEEGEK